MAKPKISKEQLLKQVLDEMRKAKKVALADRDKLKKMGLVTGGSAPYFKESSAYFYKAYTAFVHREMFHGTSPSATSDAVRAALAKIGYTPAKVTARSGHPGRGIKKVTKNTSISLGAYESDAKLKGESYFTITWESKQKGIKDHELWEEFGRPADGSYDGEGEKRMRRLLDKTLG
jgi:hypothetical protein